MILTQPHSFFIPKKDFLIILHPQIFKQHDSIKIDWFWVNPPSRSAHPSSSSQILFQRRDRWLWRIVSWWSTLRAKKLIISGGELVNFLTSQPRKEKNKLLFLLVQKGCLSWEHISLLCVATHFVSATKKSRSSIIALRHNRFAKNRPKKKLWLWWKEEKNSSGKNSEKM